MRPKPYLAMRFLDVICPLLIELFSIVERYIIFTSMGDLRSYIINFKLHFLLFHFVL